MKKQAYTMIAMIVLVGSMAVAAQAQTSGHTQLIANIPFDFNVGTKTLPAGEYTIVQVNPASGSAVLQLRSKDGSGSAMVQMNPVMGKASDSAHLVFHRYGNQYFFSQSWIDGEGSGLQAPKPRVERELASIKATNETVAMTARK
jgi:hypothetical protein